MFGLPKIPRIVIIGGVAAAIIIAALYMIPAEDWEEGAPTASISVKITETESEETYLGDLEIEPASMLDRAMSVHPMTTYTADVPPLDPLLSYTISFTITVTTLGNIAETYTTTVEISGENTQDYYKLSGHSGAVLYSIGPWGQGGRISTQTQTTQYDVPAAITLPSFAGIDDQIDGDNIIGEFIDGSVFTVNIISESAAGSYGMTTATIGLTVGAGGTLYVQIDGIETTVG